MGSLEIHSWSLSGLIGAYIDLALAYFLLCAATFGFFASKFLSMVGLNLPCPCDGFFGYTNVNYCWHELLFYWPIRKIFEVQMSVKTKFPFDLIWSRNESDPNKKNLIRGKNCENGFVELGSDEACSSSFSSSRIQNLVDRESGFEAKGKRVMTNLKQRPGLRRRKRANLGYGLPSVARVVPSPCDFRKMKEQCAESLGSLRGREDGPLPRGKCEIS